MVHALQHAQTALLVQPSSPRYLRSTHISYTDPSSIANPRRVYFPGARPGASKGIQRKEPTFPVTLGAILDNLDRHANQTIYIPCTLFHTWGIGALNIAIAGTCTMIMSRHLDLAPVR